MRIHNCQRSVDHRIESVKGPAKICRTGSFGRGGEERSSPFFCVPGGGRRAVFVCMNGMVNLPGRWYNKAQSGIQEMESTIEDLTNEEAEQIGGKIHEIVPRERNADGEKYAFRTGNEYGGIIGGEQPESRRRSNGRTDRRYPER